MPGFEWIGKEEQKAVNEIFNEGGVLFAHGFDNLRKHYHVREFESKCKQYFECKHALAVSSGTAGLKIALKAVGVQPGDEVITQGFNFIATIEAILDCGATPIIANIDETLNIDPNELSKLLSKKTSAIIPVHMLGVSAKMNEIVKIAKFEKIPVIEDNCEAIGGKYAEKHLGTLGNVGVLSFDQGKMIATGEGGMLLTNNYETDQYARQYHDHGHENNISLPRGRDNRTRVGFNYRMTEMQAAVGKVQLSKLNRMLYENKKRYSILYSELEDKFKFRSVPKNNQPNYDTFILIEKNKKYREKIIKILQELKFGTKNLPDAMEWHCAAYWDHALSPEQVKKSINTKIILEQTIAIPIWLNRKVYHYEQLKDRLLSL